MKMSLLPFLLSELQDLSVPTTSRAPSRRPSCSRRHHQYYRRPQEDVEDLLADLLLYRDAARPESLLREALAPALVLQCTRPRQPVKRPATSSGKDAGDAVVNHTSSGLLINVDVQQFLPEELSVRVNKDQRCVVVEGMHEERPDEHGYVRRQFTRRYMLPDNVDPDTVVSRLTSDGVLQVTALPAAEQALPQSNVKNVPITYTGQPAVTTTTQEDATGEATARGEDGELVVEVEVEKEEDKRK